MWNLALNVLAVGAEDARQFDLFVVDRKLVTFAQQQLDQRNGRAFAQVVCASLEAQAENADLLLTSLRDQLGGTFDLQAIADQQRIEQRRFQVERTRLVGQRAYILWQTRTAEGEAGLQVVRRQVQFRI